MVIGSTRLPWQVLPRQVKHLRRSCIRNLLSRLPGIYDRSFLPWTILVFTQPLIGDYGVPSSARDEHGLLKYLESPNIQCCGVVVADYAEKYSQWTAAESLSEWYAREGVPAISGVDTRSIVTCLREEGSSLACIATGEEYDADQDAAFVDPEQINLVRKVGTKAPFHVSSQNGDMHVAVIECGVKENILRSLVGHGASVIVFPNNFPIHKVAHHFDGIFISNGPGDPTHCQETIYHLARLMESSQVPVMGICLGHQLLALAAGAVPSNSSMVTGPTTSLLLI